jgi:adenosylcobyric acid synthase
MKTAFLIAAPTSGSGKTTIARGLMALLKSKGMIVQPFKCGPDYIDTKFHEAVCGRPSINLDTFMASPEHVRELFAHYGEDADVCIVEGMMGLFDGYDREKGSSYEIARVLDIPVVLVVDAKSAAYSMAALLSGFIHFREDVHIAGVIFNKVGSEKHFSMLQQVCENLGIECFGYLPKSTALEQGSRYLGLDFSELPENRSLMESLEEHINLTGLFSRVSVSPPKLGGVRGGLNNGIRAVLQTTPPKGTPPKLGGETNTLVARNAESFSFIYQENIDRFGNVYFFDPEKEVPDFSGIDLLYLPGGYPEKHLEVLVGNEACRKAIRDFAEQGGRVVAECGGMMYLCESIVTDEGEYPMCGVLPYKISARKADRKLSLGYRQFMLEGKEYRGHEFHYTQFLGEVPKSVVQVYDAKGNPVPTPVFRYKNVLASYTHLAPTPSPIPEQSSPTRSLSPGEESLNTHAIDNRGVQGNQSPLPSGGAGGGLHPVMFAGTGSDVGKSIVAAAFCRIFKQDGYQPAPFKAQNMALNSYATPEGFEIGRAQAVQAEAAGIPCHTDMNPLLLKPQSDHTSQVILNGKPIGNKDAYDYWRPTPSPSRGERSSNTPANENRGMQSNQSPLPSGGVGGGFDFRKEVCDAFDRLAKRYNPIVMEGAGSIAEINLKDRDLVNMSMSRHAKADVILVGDIDRGGVFASVYGSIALQSPEDRKLIKGIIINKFRGDMRLFDEGRKMLEDICGVPVLGVIPYYKDIYIDEEDSVALEQKRRQLAEGKVNVAVVLLRHISNYTDFDTLERDPRVNLFYTNNTSDIQQADIIILPGTKATLDDLMELRRNGCAQAIQRAHRDGKMVVGICGGYQMLGQTVEDPDGIEGSITSLPGLGLLPIHTTMTPEKTTKQVTFMFEGQECKGYEIHQGVSDTDEAILQTDHCIGTYIHGFLDNAPVIEHLLSEKVKVKSEQFASAEKNPQEFKEQQYDKLADYVRKHVDIDQIYKILTND